MAAIAVSILAAVWVGRYAWQVERLSREDLAASYEDSDRNPPVFDPATHTAPVPESFKASYQAWMDAEFWRLQVFEEMGQVEAVPLGDLRDPQTLLERTKEGHGNWLVTSVARRP